MYVLPVCSFFPYHRYYRVFIFCKVNTKVWINVVLVGLYCCLNTRISIGYGPRIRRNILSTFHRRFLVVFIVFCVRSSKGVHKMADKDDRWSIERLRGDNWPTWKFQMKHVLLAKDFWNLTQGDEVLATDANEETRAAFKVKCQKALSVIVMSIDPSQLYLITTCETAKDAWDSLKQQFESSTLHNKLLLKKQYFRSEMSEGSSMEKHLKTMKELTDKLAAVGSPISEEDQVVTLLGSLPSKYNPLVTALEARGDDIKLQFVQQALLNEEQKFEKPSVNASESLLVTQNTKVKKKNKFTCYHCGKEGHIKRNCIKLKRMNAERAKIAVEQEIAFTSTPMTNFKGWWIDSGATSHVCNDRQLFTNLDLSHKEKITVANGEFLQSEGRGECDITVID